jgi:hypothetical protein
MAPIEWFPAITTTGLFAAALWLGKEAISARLGRSIQHEFDKKIEDVRSELRGSEERLKSELREKEAAISALRGGALSALTARQAAVDKRRLEAVDQLWAAFNSLSRARGLVATMSVIKFEEAAKIAEKDPRARELFQAVTTGFDRSKIDTDSADLARPFLSPMAWAVFAAYRVVIMHSVVRWEILKSGMGTKDYTNREAIERLIVTALPHYKDYIEEHGPNAYYGALDALEEKLLDELRAMLSSSEFDRANVEQAAEIVRQAHALQAAGEAEKVQ